MVCPNWRPEQSPEIFLPIANFTDGRGKLSYIQLMLVKSVHAFLNTRLFVMFLIFLIHHYSRTRKPDNFHSPHEQWNTQIKKILAPHKLVI
jgi:hypothetical protein